jgi:hypothetical protein
VASPLEGRVPQEKRQLQRFSAGTHGGQQRRRMDRREQDRRDLVPLVILKGDNWFQLWILARATHDRRIVERAFGRAHREKGPNGLGLTAVPRLHAVLSCSAAAISTGATSGTSLTVQRRSYGAVLTAKRARLPFSSVRVKDEPSPGTIEPP